MNFGMLEARVLIPILPKFGKKRIVDEPPISTLLQDLLQRSADGCIFPTSLSGSNVIRVNVC